MKRIVRYMRIAKKEALKSNDEFRFGAVLVRGNNIISTGYNQGSKTHPIQANMYPDRINTGLHAEIHTLVGLRPYDSDNSDMFIYRIRDDGSPGSAFPCSQCLIKLKEYNIRRVFYTKSNDLIPFDLFNLKT